MKLPTIPPLVQWLILLAIAIFLLHEVQPGSAESPYNGF